MCERDNAILTIVKDLDYSNFLSSIVVESAHVDGVYVEGSFRFSKQDEGLGEGGMIPFEGLLWTTVSPRVGFIGGSGKHWIGESMQFIKGQGLKDAFTYENIDKVQNNDPAYKDKPWICEKRRGMYFLLLSFTFVHCTVLQTCNF